LPAISPVSVERLMRFLVASARTQRSVRPAAPGTPRNSPSKAGLRPYDRQRQFQDDPHPQSRLTEVTWQAAAETTSTFTSGRGAQITPEMRQLMLNAIHTTMTLAVVDLLNSENYTFEEG
jgi:hypothetical protein